MSDPRPRSAALALVALLALPGAAARAQGFTESGGGKLGRTTIIDLGQGHTIVAPRINQGASLPSQGISRPARIDRVGASEEWIQEIQERRASTLSRSHQSRRRIMEAAQSQRRLVGTAARRRLAAMRALRQGNLITPQGVIRKDPPSAGQRLHRGGGGIVAMGEDEPEAEEERPEPRRRRRDPPPERRSIATIGGR